MLFVDDNEKLKIFNIEDDLMEFKDIKEEEE